jgi:hypothetical protein
MSKVDRSRVAGTLPARYVFAHPVTPLSFKFLLRTISACDEGHRPPTAKVTTQASTISVVQNRGLHGSRDLNSAGVAPLPPSGSSHCSVAPRRTPVVGAGRLELTRKHPKNQGGTLRPLADPHCSTATR